MGSWDFEEFVRSTYASVWERLRSRARSAADAEDAIQQAYVDLWRLRAKLAEPPGAGFVIQRAFWKLLGSGRAPEPLPEASDLPHPDPLAAASAGAAEQLAALEACLAQLRVPQRWCVLLSAYWDIPRPEAAELLDLTPAAYDGHRKRGHDELAKCLRGRERAGTA